LAGVLILLVVFGVAFATPAEACYLYFKPSRPVWGQQFDVHLVGGLKNQQYKMYSCRSNLAVLSGGVCFLTNGITNILGRNALTTDNNGSQWWLNVQPISKPPDWQSFAGKGYYVEFVAKDSSDRVIDRCQARANFVEIDSSGTEVLPKDYLKQECNGNTGVDTAIGCVPTGDLKELLKFLLKFALFASGGIIVLMIIATGYTVMTSGGNPEKLQAAKENVIALFSGLALIAFSLILLYTIGGGVLGLPTF
jgi:hypothetical protein